MEDTPATTNRQAQNTWTPSPASISQADRYLFDWISATFPETFTLSELCTFLNLKIEWFTECPNGLNGYRKQLQFGSIRILTNGNERMGHHLLLSGQGVRQFESRWTGNHEPWEAWSNTFRLWRQNGAKIRRLDVAKDVYTFALVKTLLRAISGGQVVSRWRQFRVMASGRVAEGREQGITIYFGGGSSNAKIRVYDKAAEQGISGLWDRVELQLHRERAEAFVQLFCDMPKLGKLFSMVLNNYISVRVPNGDTNKHRWPLDEWWVNFLEDSERVKLSFEKPQRSMEELEQWFKKAMAPTLATIFEHKSGDMDYLKSLLLDGYLRRSPRHINMLKEEE